MKKLLLIAILLLATNSYAKMRPVYTTSTNSGSTFWMASTNFYKIYDAIVERYSAAEKLNYTYNSYPITYPLVPTNRFWAYNYVYRNVYSSSTDPGQQYPEAQEQLYYMTQFYVAITNDPQTNGYYNLMSTNDAIVNWTYKSMHDFLKDNFTNTDGTVGVGIYTNYPTATDTNWLWTLSWETNEWSITLGSLTFMITNRVVTNGVVYYYAGWKYFDGDRIVRKPLTDWDGPPEWSVTRYSSTTNDPASLGWISPADNQYDVWWEWHEFGRMFDYVDMTGISNSLTFKMGSTNWTSLDNNLSLDIIGHTNYVSSWVPSVGNGTNTSYRSVTDWGRETTDVSAKTNGDIVALTYKTFDAGGYSNEVLITFPAYKTSYPTNFISGLCITNTSVFSNTVPVTNHLGDTITLKMYSKNRLYGWPKDPSSANWRTIPNLSPFVDNRQLNEMAAVLQLLRVVSYSYLTAGSLLYFNLGINETPALVNKSWGLPDSIPYHYSVYDHVTNSWVNAQNRTVANWPTNVSANTTSLRGHHATVGFEYYTTQFLYKAEAFAGQTPPVVKYNTYSYLTYSNVGATMEWYIIPVKNTYCLYEETEIPPQNYGVNVFDAQGDVDAFGNTIEEGKYMYMGQTNMTAGPNMYSKVIGPYVGGDTNVFPDWCDAPTTNVSQSKGWQVYDIRYVKYWNFINFTNSIELP